MATTQCELASRHCEPCEGGQATLAKDAVVNRLQQLNSDWSADDAGRAIERDFPFKGFLKTMSFVNAVAWIANHEMHHPDLEVGYGHCRVTLTTHAIGGLSDNDFILAAKIDALMA